jgi:hypothetical protein
MLINQIMVVIISYLDAGYYGKYDGAEISQSRNY